MSKRTKGNEPPMEGFRYTDESKMEATVTIRLQYPQIERIEEAYKALCEEEQGKEYPDDGTLGYSQFVNRLLCIALNRVWPIREKDIDMYYNNEILPEYGISGDDAHEARMARAKRYFNHEWNADWDYGLYFYTDWEKVDRAYNPQDRGQED